MSDHERYPVGDFIFERMTEADREILRRFMAAANAGDEHDEAYEALDPFGINTMRAHCAEGAPVEDGHIRLQLEWMAHARLVDETMDGIDWGYLTLIASAWDKEREDRLRNLFVLATGITDEDAFDERLRAERRAKESARG